MEIEYTDSFLKKYKKLDKNVKHKFEKKEKVLIKEIFHASLRTHKLSGKLANCYSFSIDFHFRVIFRFSEDRKTAYFLDIGTHEIYE